MRHQKRMFLYLSVWICVLFFIQFSGQAVFAGQPNTNQVQSGQTNSNVSNSASTSGFNWNMVLESIKWIGGSLFAAVVALITIYKFVLEKRYDVESVEIDWINKKPVQNREYTDFLVFNISKDGRDVDLISAPNPYYLDISIKFFVPDGRKLMKNIIVKKMIFHMNGYELVCVPKIKTKTGLKKCTFNKQKKSCRILMKWLTIKEESDRVALNQTGIFRNPDYVDMHLVWYPQIMLSSIVGFLLPKKPTIEFEKIEHENGSTRIGIRSRGIY